MIDYSILAQSCVHYSKLGYARIEAPWTVSRAVSDITKPPGIPDWNIENKNKVLVASGEQSFLYLYLKEFLPRGRFQTITPCFREEAFDLYHTKYFMKNELIDTSDTDKNSLLRMVGHAETFFAEFLGPAVKVIEINGTFDIVCSLKSGDVELGSYGIRECEFLKWVYGTGVAEPRLSNVLRTKRGQDVSRKA